MVCIDGNLSLFRYCFFGLAGRVDVIMKRHCCLIRLFLTGVGVRLRWAMLFNILVIRFCIACVAQDSPDVHYVEGLLAERAASHCGVYSLYAVANALGTQPELERLVAITYSWNVQ